MKYNPTLEGKVAARNRVNREANERVAAMLVALLPFVGQKVCKVTGELLQKVNDSLPQVPNEPNLAIFYSTGHGYSITARFKVSEIVEGGRSVYMEELVYLAELSNGILTKVLEFEPRTYNFTAQYVNDARKEIQDAENALTQARHKIERNEFGRHDN